VEIQTTKNLLPVPADWGGGGTSGTRRRLPEWLRQELRNRGLWTIRRRPAAHSADRSARTPLAGPADWKAPPWKAAGWNAAVPRGSAGAGLVLAASVLRRCAAPRWTLRHSHGGGLRTAQRRPIIVRTRLIISMGAKHGRRSWI